MMKRYFLFLLPLLFACCKESVDTSTRYVFSENTIVSYMQNHADVYGVYLPSPKFPSRCRREA